MHYPKVLILSLTVFNDSTFKRITELVKLPVGILRNFKKGHVECVPTMTRPAKQNGQDFLYSQKKKVPCPLLPYSARLHGSIRACAKN